MKAKMKLKRATMIDRINSMDRRSNLSDQTEKVKGDILPIMEGDTPTFTDRVFKSEDGKILTMPENSHYIHCVFECEIEFGDKSVFKNCSFKRSSTFGSKSSFEKCRFDREDGLYFNDSGKPIFMFGPFTTMDGCNMSHGVASYSIQRNCVIERSTFMSIGTIRECSAIGDECEFGDGTVFEESCSFGDGCLFGKSCEFFDECEFGNVCMFGMYAEFHSHCLLGDGCMLSDETEFGDNCVLCNPRIDGSIKRIKFGDECVLNAPIINRRVKRIELGNGCRVTGGDFHLYDTQQAGYGCSFENLAVHEGVCLKPGTVVEDSLTLYKESYGRVGMRVDDSKLDITTFKTMAYTVAEVGSTNVTVAFETIYRNEDNILVIVHKSLYHKLDEDFNEAMKTAPLW